MRTSVAVSITLVTISICVEGLQWSPKDLYREPPAPMARGVRSIPFQYLDQRVDNFNPQNVATYQQAYLENDEFFSENGPLFVFIGGEWVIEDTWVLGGHTYDLAEEFNASVLYVEHRFYGRSQPTDDLSTESLRLLTVEQALADLANFIVQIKRKDIRYANSKVILVGGSYAASMATWFRQKYPHLAVGAWASSGPFLAQLDFLEYMEVSSASIRNIGGQSCHNRIEKAFAAAEQLIAENRLDEFRQHFSLCENFGSHHLDVYATFHVLTAFVSGTAQYHKSGEIQRMCEDLTRNETSSADDLSEFGRFFRNLLGLTDPSICLDSYLISIESYQNETIAAPEAKQSGRQWFYQMCTEFGWFFTTTSVYQPFGSSVPMELFYNMCSDIFGEHINRSTMRETVDRTNAVFGAWNPNVRNVYFTNGLVDPWRAMSIQEDLNEWSPADVVPDSAHTGDLYSVTGADSAEMLLVKDRIRSLIHIWLAL